MAELTRTFIDALHTLEDTGDEQPLVRLFADGAEVSNPLVKDSAPAPFWRSYRGAFDEIRSEFRNIVGQDGVSILEWTSEGSAHGEPVRYGGTSVIEHDGSRVTAFRTYFDTAKLRLTEPAEDDGED